MIIQTRIKVIRIPKTFNDLFLQKVISLTKKTGKNPIIDHKNLHVLLIENFIITSEHRSDREQNDS